MTRLHDGTVAGRNAVMGALKLYLNFINLFLFMLRLLGNRRLADEIARRHRLLRHRHKVGADAEGALSGDDQKEAAENEEVARLRINGIEALYRNRAIPKAIPSLGPYPISV